jgi:hypothetical protein
MTKVLKVVLFTSFFLVGAFYLFRDKGFYHDTFADWDLKRLPLKDPYQIYSSDGEFWVFTKDSGPSYGLDFQTDLPLSQTSVDSVAVYKNFVIILSVDQFNEIRFIVSDCKTRKSLNLNSLNEVRSQIGKIGLSFKHPKDVYRDFILNPERETLLRLIEIK